MNYKKTDLPGVWLIEPEVFGDERGYFMETFKEEEFLRKIGKVHFLQDNESCSSQGVLRGMHYQVQPFSQSKLVRVIQGSVLDVAVDIRQDSPTYGRYVAVELSGENRLQLFIPRGFAHGFYVMSEKAVFTYKVDYPYTPTHERGFRFDDPEVAIDWRLLPGIGLTVSEKDRKAPLLCNADNNFLFYKS
jgi:dTDP-4-dehydrorhamnose 3,5-epimerase